MYLYVINSGQVWLIPRIQDGLKLENILPNLPYNRLKNFLNETHLIQKKHLINVNT